MNIIHLQVALMPEQMEVLLDAVAKATKQVIELDVQTAKEVIKEYMLSEMGELTPEQLVRFNYQFDRLSLSSMVTTITHNVMEATAVVSQLRQQVDMLKLKLSEAGLENGTTLH